MSFFLGDLGHLSKIPTCDQCQSSVSCFSRHHLLTSHCILFPQGLTHALTSMTVLVLVSFL